MGRRLPGGSSVWKMGIVAALLAFGTGCVSLTPFEEVHARAGDDAFVRVGDRLVHVERAGSGEAVVLIHGFGGSSWSWRHVVPALAEDHRVVALDLNGFGWTERPREGEAYTLDGQAHLVLAVMDALGLERADLVGHSYGGGLALWIAANHPERLRSLVLVDSTLPAYSVERRRALAEWRPLVAAFVRTVALRPSFVRRGLLRSVADPAVVTDELVAGYLERLKVDGAIDAYHGLTANVDGPRPEVDLGSIAIPTLVVWGAEDELLAAHLGEAAARAMPDARFVAIPGCGHLPMEEDPAALVEAIRPFLAEVSRRPADPVKYRQ